MRTLVAVTTNNSSADKVSFRCNRFYGSFRLEFRSAAIFRTRLLSYSLRGFLGYARASCMALIIRAFSKAITLWAANIWASRVASSENGRTVFR